MGTPAVFLDRDGVLNKAFVRNGVPHPPQSVDELEILPGVVEACESLHQAGFLLIVVTNQPDIARGTQTLQEVNRINDEVRRLTGVDDLFMCPHDNHHRCECRKPRPGLLLAAAKAYSIDLGRSVMVGDRDKDIDAGRSAGCRTVFVSQGHGPLPQSSADLTVASLRDAVGWITQR